MHYARTSDIVRRDYTDGEKIGLETTWAERMGFLFSLEIVKTYYILVTSTTLAKALIFSFKYIYFYGKLVESIEYHVHY